MVLCLQHFGIFVRRIRKSDGQKWIAGDDA